MGEETKTVFSVLKAARDYLESRDIHEARRSCELIMAFLLKCKPLDLYFKLDDVLDARSTSAMRRATKRLSEHEPVQYILGEWDFMDHAFKVDARALIPRPETEQLVQLVLECEALWSEPEPFVLDIGTGTGCIAICLALAKPGARILGIDVSHDALELAAENATRHAVLDRLAFSDQELNELVEPGSVSAVVANLPYIPEEDYRALPAHILEHEPELALNGGPEGLRVIASVVEESGLVLKDGGYLFLEIDHRQGAAVTALCTQAGFTDVTVLPDYAGQDRFIRARMVDPES